MPTGREIARDVESGVRAHQHLLAALEALIDRDALDVTAPSRLPGWSRGHVLAHIRLSGDGHRRLIEAAARGEIGLQYPGGAAGRAAYIELEATLVVGEQIDRLRSSSERLEAAWVEATVPRRDGLTWEGEGEGPYGRVPIADLPFMRLREVVVHHVDLDIGEEFGDLPDDYVRLELRRMEMLWRARQPMGLTPLPDAALGTPPPTRLAWLLGRTDIDGLDPADIF
jgi:maleylpyruvate isomerase